MKKLCSITLFVLLLIQVSAKGAEKPFRSKIVEVVPSVSDHYEMVLLLAGKPENRFQRSQQLKASLPKLADINPMEQLRELMGWLAVTAMVESAVASAKQPDESWELELAGLYRHWSSAETAFNMFASAAATTALSQGGEDDPMVKLARQLTRLPAYARRGVRWIAKRRLKAKPGKELRRALYEGLVEVNRREGDWAAMHMAAARLSYLRNSPEVQAWQAEALFELGRMEEGEKALKKSKGDPQAKKRRRLAGLLKVMKKKRTPKAMAETAAALIDLGEFWRVKQLFSEGEVLRAAHPGLDEAFIQAAMGGSLDYPAAWTFGRRAKGQPPTPVFLAHRIGAGLMMIMRGFYGGAAAGRPSLELDEVLQVEKDLRAFRPTDPRLADLTGVYLTFLRFVLNQDPGSPARKALAQEVLSYNRTYPGDLPGVQMVYLLAQLGAEGQATPDAWEVIGRYRKSMGEKQIPTYFLPVYAGAAVKQAIREKDIQPVKEVLAWLEKRFDRKPTQSSRIWKAHLLTVSGLLSDDKSGGKILQQAVTAYGRVINTFGEDETAQQTLEALCDAVASVSTLLMQGQSADQAAGLLDQASQVCGSFPATASVAAVVNLMAGKQGADPKKDLTGLAENLASHQARIQAQLWLGVLAEVSGDDKSAEKHFEKAAGMIAEERKRGAVVPLAPDHRSMVAFSGNFNMGAGYSSKSPFGLAIEVTVSTRMFLFPPAAVDEKKIQPYLKKVEKK